MRPIFAFLFKKLSGIIPLMTSNTTPFGTVSYSGFVGGGSPYTAFGIRGLLSVSGWASNAPPAWLQYKFPFARTIISYTFTNTNYPSETYSFTFLGSNNGLTWATLDTQNSLSMGGGTAYSKTLSTPVSYCFYRLNFTSSVTFNQVGLQNFQVSGY